MSCRNTSRPIQQQVYEYSNTKSKKERSKIQVSFFFISFSISIFFLSFSFASSPSDRRNATIPFFSGSATYMGSYLSKDPRGTARYVPVASSEVSLLFRHGGCGCGGVGVGERSRKKVEHRREGKQADGRDRSTTAKRKASIPPSKSRKPFVATG